MGAGAALRTFTKFLMFQKITMHPLADSPFLHIQFELRQFAHPFMIRDPALVVLVGAKLVNTFYDFLSAEKLTLRDVRVVDERIEIRGKPFEFKASLRPQRSWITSEKLSMTAAAAFKMYLKCQREHSSERARSRVLKSLTK